MSQTHDDIPSPTNTEEENIDQHKDNKEKNEEHHKKKIVWSQENEMIMVEWCDVAQCYKWLNTRAHSKFAYMHAWFTIPAIIFSTISGTASFAQDSLPESARTFAPAIIGTINITIGILTTIQQYLKISELNEAHRVSAISWDKFARNIRIELAKKPNERSDAGVFIKHCRAEFDRLMETSPNIDEKVILEFKHKFAGQPGSEKRKRYEELKKPDICDTIISANETRHKWYLEDLDVNNIDSETDLALQQKNKLIKQQQQQLEDREKELLNKHELEEKTVRIQIENQKTKKLKQQERDSYINERIEQINLYVKNFVDIYERKPLRDEIMDNLGNSIETEIIEIFFASYKTIDNV